MRGSPKLTFQCNFLEAVWLGGLGGYPPQTPLRFPTGIRIPEFVRIPDEFRNHRFHHFGFRWNRAEPAHGHGTTISVEPGFRNSSGIRTNSGIRILGIRVPVWEPGLGFGGISSQIPVTKRPLRKILGIFTSHGGVHPTPPPIQWMGVW